MPQSSNTPPRRRPARLQRNARKGRALPSVSAAAAAHVAQIEVITVTIPQAAALLGVGRTYLYTLLRTDPEFPRRIKMGRASRLLLPDLRKWAERRAQSGCTPGDSSLLGDRGGTGGGDGRA